MFDSTSTRYTVRFISRIDGVERVATFATSAAAWEFFRQCDAAGDMAGYPAWY